MSIINSELLMGAGGDEAGYQIPTSCRFSKQSNSYMQMRQTVTKTSSTTLTVSIWVKGIDYNGTEYILSNQPNSDYPLWVSGGKFLSGFAVASSATWYGALTPQTKLDFTGWNHVVIALDTTQAVAADRAKGYINGVEATWSTYVGPVLNATTSFGSAYNHSIGRYSSTYLDGYLAEYHYIDGQQLNQFDFGEFDSNGNWRPIEYTGTYGNAGVYLKFDNDSSTANLGLDSGPNGLNFNTFGFAVSPVYSMPVTTDSPVSGDPSLDTGAGQELPGNYPVIGERIYGDYARVGTLYDGKLSGYSTAGNQMWFATIELPPYGKWYYEMRAAGGVAATDTSTLIRGMYNNTTNQTAFSYRPNGGTQNLVGSPSFSTYQNGDRIGVAINMDTHEVAFYKNGVQQGTGFYQFRNWDQMSTTGLQIGCYYSASNEQNRVNFGQIPFEHAAPSGYKAICLANFNAPTIKNSSKHFAVVNYTGNGGTQTITGLNFQPDLIWFKGRSETWDWYVVNSFSGSGKTATITASAERNDAQSALAFQGFTADGFTVGTSTQVKTNTSGQTYAAFCWKAGSTTNVTAGSLNSSYYDTAKDYISSSALSGAIGAFNGNFLTGSATYTSTAQTLTSQSITINNTLEIFTNRYGYQDTEVTINGTTYYSEEIERIGWAQISIPAADLPLTSSGNIQIRDAGGAASGIWGVRVDGKILIDSTATPPNIPSLSHSYKANPEAGFSIVNWTGDGNDPSYYAHGLNAQPQFIILKDLDASTSWYTMTQYGDSNPEWESSDSATQISNLFKVRNPNSVYFTGGNLTSVSGRNYIAYCWAPIEGYSRMGIYTGGGTAKPAYVFTGFAPKWVMIKCISTSTTNWVVNNTDNASRYNEISKYLYPNTTDTEQSSGNLIFDSTGFHCTSGNGFFNTAGREYWYMAFADNPLGVGFPSNENN